MQAIEFSFPSTLQLSTSAQCEYFWKIIFAVIYVLSGLYTPRFKLIQFLTLTFAVFLPAGQYLILTTCSVRNGLIVMKMATFFRNSIWRQPPSLNLILVLISDSTSCIQHRIYNIPTKFGENRSNSKGMAKVFRNSRWRQPPSHSR